MANTSGVIHVSLRYSSRGSKIISFSLSTLPMTVACASLRARLYLSSVYSIYISLERFYSSKKSHAIPKYACLALHPLVSG